MPKLNILKSWRLESAVEFLVLLAHLLLLGPSSRWLTWGGGWVRMVTVGAGGLWGDWSPRAGGGQQGGPAAHGLMLREGTSSKHRVPRGGPAAPWPAGSSTRRETGSWEWKAWWQWCSSAGRQACTVHTVRPFPLFSCGMAMSSVCQRAHSCVFLKSLIEF